MFILKLGAEALSLKSESLESKVKESYIISTNETSSSSSTISESSGHMLENLLNGCLVESALLLKDTQIKRCRSVANASKSAFIQNGKTNDYRPRSETAPQRSLIFETGFPTISNLVRKRKFDSNITDGQTSSKSILFESLSKPASSLSSSIISNVSGDSSDLIAQRFKQLDSLTLPISETQSSFSTLSIDEMKRLRLQINVLLKRIMHIIKSYSNYSSMSETRRLHFVSNLWYKIMILIIIHMDADSCRYMFRWLLLSIFNGEDNIDCTRRDKILLLEKLQEYFKSYFWLKTNSDLLRYILFWFFSKYGYPDVFCMSTHEVIFKLNDLVSDKAQMDSILNLIRELSEITESHVQQLFCQHLPATSSMAEFLIQWT